MTPNAGAWPLGGPALLNGSSGLTVGIDQKGVALSGSRLFANSMLRA